MNRRFVFIIFLALFLTQAISVQAATLTYRDKLGRTVTVRTPVKRAVLYETYELLPVTGSWDRVAGISRYAYDNDLLLAIDAARLRRIPAVGSAMDSNAEALLKLKPDVVLTWTVNPAIVRFLEQKGLPVISIYPESIAELYDVMRMEGKLFDREKNVERVITRMEAMFSLIRKRVAGIPPARRKKAVYLTGKQTRVNGRIGVTNDLFTIMGLENAGKVITERSTDVTLERLISWNPDLIFIWGSARYSAADLKGNSQWRHVKAVEKGAVFKEPKWGTWSPRLAPIALWMAAMAYPERFRDMDISRVIDRFFRDVYGISYAKVTRIEK